MVGVYGVYLGGGADRALQTQKAQLTWFARQIEQYGVVDRAGDRLRARTGPGREQDPPPAGRTHVISARNLPAHALLKRPSVEYHARWFQTYALAAKPRT